MMRVDPTNFYFLSETLVDPNLPAEKLEILHENTVDRNGVKLFTLTL